MRAPPVQAYQETSYTVFDKDITIRIGEKCDALDYLLKETSHREWAYITPYNPYSEVMPDTENEKRMKRLKDRVAEYSYLEGEGVGTDSNWKPERSLLIMGISKEEASKIGHEFSQFAIVTGQLDQPAELVMLRDSVEEEELIRLRFQRMSDQERLSRFVRMINFGEKTEYDILLRWWGQSRY
jgi:hypothetical protein